MNPGLRLTGCLCPRSCVLWGSLCPPACTPPGSVLPVTCTRVGQAGAAWHAPPPHGSPTADPRGPLCQAALVQRGKGWQACPWGPLLPLCVGSVGSRSCAQPAPYLSCCWGAPRVGRRGPWGPACAGSPAAPGSSCRAAGTSPPPGAVGGGGRGAAVCGRRPRSASPAIACPHALSHARPRWAAPARAPACTSAPRSAGGSGRPRERRYVPPPPPDTARPTASSGQASRLPLLGTVG